MTVAAMPKITEDMPRESATSVRMLPHIKDLCLADQHFDEPRRIDMVLEANLVRRSLAS